jgi:hypothetical protein
LPAGTRSNPPTLVFDADTKINVDVQDDGALDCKHKSIDYLINNHQVILFITSTTDMRFKLYFKILDGIASPLGMHIFS